jgi:D-alanyl-D-alanine carboxypeptidase
LALFDANFVLQLSSKLLLFYVSKKMRILFNCLIVAALLYETCSPAFAIARDTVKSNSPTIDVAEIDKIVAKHMREKSIPGVALAVVHKGKALYVKGLGKVNLEHDIAATSESVFLIGSVSKPIIAMGITLLAQQGKLSVDDLVSKHIPDTPATWREITLRHLLNHTAGLVRESPAFDGNKVVPDIDLIKATFPLPLDFPTGSKFQYCNICYFTLAEIITRVSGQAWPTFMTKHFFTPAGMSATRASSVTSLITNRVASYSVKDGVYTIEREYAALRPSGAFASTINDLVKLENSLYQHQVLTAENLTRMQQPAKLNDGNNALFNDQPNTGYGLGWALATFNGQLRVWHGGSLAGFRAVYRRYPESGVAIIVLTNLATARPNEIESDIAALLFPPLPTNSISNVKVK